MFVYQVLSIVLILVLAFAVHRAIYHLSKEMFCPNLVCWVYFISIGQLYSSKVLRGSVVLQSPKKRWLVLYLLLKTTNQVVFHIHFIESGIS